MNKAVRKYLETWAEPEARLAERLRGGRENVLVVPARREGIELLEGIRPLAAASPGRTLVILVVNGPPEEVAENASLLARLRDREEAALGPGAFVVAEPEFDLLVVDRASPGRELPVKRGVGLARKIGCDVALALRARGRLESSWIHTSDADAVQPTDRFAVAEAAAAPGRVALTFPFRHESGEDAALARAVRLYERSLRYWVQGLRRAGSPYAFHTIGSTLAVQTDAYARVRGFPRRAAGEDFYLLNKLAKIGEVFEPAGDPIRLQARRSDRVPFGTGAAVGRLLDETESFRVIHPRCFTLLERLLRAIDEFAGGAEFRVDATDLSSNERIALVDTVEALEIERSLRRLRREWRAFHTWFDAFRTFKFLHGVRDRGLGTVGENAVEVHAECSPGAGAGLTVREIPTRGSHQEARPSASSRR